MKNLEQIRAANALQATADEEIAGTCGGEVAKKVPTMIRENGFLGALAFATEKKNGNELKNPGHYLVFAAIIKHLAHPAVARIKTKGRPEDLMQWLSEHADATSTRLRDMTAESLAYLNYFRRFARKGDSDQ